MTPEKLDEIKVRAERVWGLYPTLHRISLSVEDVLALVTEIEQLREALRSHAIYHWAKGPLPAFDECGQCEERWPHGEAERHKPGCLAAAEEKEG